MGYPGEVIVGLSTVLQAKTRQIKSSNYASRLRAAGNLPAVFYGPGQEVPISLCLDYKEFRTALTSCEGNRSIYTLEIEGMEPQPVFLKDLQMDPMTRKAIHADFYKIQLDKPVTIKVPVVLSGKPAGVEKGGQLQSGAREIKLTTLPTSAPSEIVVDVKKLELGQSLHISQIVPPQADMKIIFTADLPVATVVIPKGMRAELEAAAKEEEEKKAKK